MKKNKALTLIGILLLIPLLAIPMGAGAISGDRNIGYTHYSPGSNILVTVDYNTDELAQGGVVDESFPDGWDAIEIVDESIAYKSSTREWIYWEHNMNAGSVHTFTYLLCVPTDAACQSYDVSGSMSAHEVASVGISGDTSMTITDDLPQGDTDGNQVLDMNDVVHLARHYFFLEYQMFPEYEIILANSNIDCNGNTDMDDVVYLARHYFFLEYGMFPDYATLYPC